MLTKHDASALSRLFSATVVRELGKLGRSPLFSRLVSQLNNNRLELGDSTVGDAFEAAFNLLRTSSYRDEYIFRSAITQKLVLGRHNLNTATVLNEFRTENSKVDIAILNGTSTAYEIKSDRDSLYRLADQIRDYRKFFASVNVLTNELRLEDTLKSVPDDVGIVVLSNRFTIRTVRQAINRPDRVEPEVILNSIRVEEAKQILFALGQEIPDVPNTRIRAELHRLFSNLESHQVHEQMVKVLSRTRSQSSLEPMLGLIPRSLKAAVISIKPNSKVVERIVLATKQPIASVYDWT